jgi:NAD-dependent dihydropyrimidine dehydrogenase PreA subunit
MPHVINPRECAACYACEDECEAGAIRQHENGQTFVIDPATCTDCGDCLVACPTGAIAPPPAAEAVDQVP